MSFVLEGTVYIPLADLWEFAGKYLPVVDGISFGKPRVEGDDLIIDVAAINGDCPQPQDWSVKPAAITQWEKK